MGFGRNLPNTDFFAIGESLETVIDISQRARPAIPTATTLVKSNNRMSEAGTDIMNGNFAFQANFVIIRDGRPFHASKQSAMIAMITIITNYPSQCLNLNGL
jgi:hypothetical protein